MEKLRTFSPQAMQPGPMRNSQKRNSSRKKVKVRSRNLKLRLPKKKNEPAKQEKFLAV